jgi:hypothetical protein
MVKVFASLFLPLALFMAAVFAARHMGFPV